jgi:hypothetical protein
MAKLTDTQLIVLSKAAAREGGLATVPNKMNKAAASKVGASLVARKLMREVRGFSDSIRIHQHDPAMALKPAGLGTINSECTSQPEAIRREIDQKIVSISRKILPKGTSHTKSLQSAIMNWVDSYLYISREYELPCIAYAPTNVIAVVRHKNSHSKHLGQDIGAYDDAYEYDLSAREVDGKNVRRSIHVSSPDGLSPPKSHRTQYECLWKRESLAYAAQEQLLRLHESNLWESFGIDRTIFS